MSKGKHCGVLTCVEDASGSSLSQGATQAVDATVGALVARDCLSIENRRFGGQARCSAAPNKVVGTPTVDASVVRDFFPPEIPVLVQLNPLVKGTKQGVDTPTVDHLPCYILHGGKVATSVPFLGGDGDKCVWGKGLSPSNCALLAGEHWGSRTER